MRLSDCLVIAHTKIKAHKARTRITVMVCALLMATPIALSLVTAGIKQSVLEITKSASINIDTTSLDKQAQQYTILDFDRLSSDDSYSLLYLQQQIVSNFCNNLIFANSIFSFVFIIFCIWREIIDSHQETAIYRAIGYRLSHITQIYLVYSLILVIRAIILSLSIAVFLAYVINGYLQIPVSEIITRTYKLRANMNFISFNTQQLLTIFGSYLASSLIATTISLSLARRVNPVEALRAQ